jgi:hypothetical protein
MWVLTTEDISLWTVFRGRGGTTGDAGGGGWRSRVAAVVAAAVHCWLQLRQSPPPPPTFRAQQREGGEEMVEPLQLLLVRHFVARYLAGQKSSFAEQQEALPVLYRYQFAHILSEATEERLECLHGLQYRRRCEARVRLEQRSVAKHRRRMHLLTTLLAMFILGLIITAFFCYLVILSNEHEEMRRTAAGDQ